MNSDNIWITRKSRIYAEMRLRRNHSISQFLMIYYSFILVLISVWNLLGNNQIINLFSIFASIAVLVFSVYLSAQRFIERAMSMQNCYIKLAELYSKMKKAEEDKNHEMISQIESEYYSALQNIENHIQFDYLNLRFGLRNDQNTTLPPFKVIDSLILIYDWLWRALFVLILFLIPVLAVIYYFQR